MTIELGQRSLLADGTKLQARYKGQQYAATVEVADGATTYRLADGRAFSSPSAAGGGITGSNVNGWRFWSVVEA